MNKIYFIRGHKVLLDRDLAELYMVETRRLNEQVKRNIKRFPEDFMFQLTDQEFENLMSQIATSSFLMKILIIYIPFSHNFLRLKKFLKSKFLLKSLINQLF